MKKYIRSFFYRGLIFGGFGPIITAIVYSIVDISGERLLISADNLLLAIISTYILAFVHAGASIFNQIENWSIGKSLLVHLPILYFAYILCYLINSWIPFKWEVIGIFTLIFIVGYMIVWLSVYFITKRLTNKLNRAI